MALRGKKSPPKTSSNSDLVVDDRAFDVACIRSAIEFYNRATRGSDASPPLPLNEGEHYEEAPGPNEAPVSEKSKLATGAFAWLPEVLKKRAQRARIPASNAPVKIAAINDYFCDRCCEDLEYCFSTFPSEHGVSRPGRFDEFDDQLFDGVAIYQRLRIVDGRPTRIQLPILRDAGNCVVYAMVVYAENRWGLLGRVRRCKYLIQPGKEYPHWFLDYRLDASGQLKRGTSPEFCSSEHANRFHQREWRKRQAEKKQTKNVKHAARPKTAGG